MTFRIVGVVLGLTLVVLGLLGRRRGRLSRGDLLGWGSIGLAIALLSMVPSIADVFRTSLGLENRLFGILVAAVILLAVLELRGRARVRILDRRLGDLVRNMATRRYRDEHTRVGHNPTATIVIAAYNEEEAIGGVLKDLPTELEGYSVEAIVVVDGGTDDTEGVVRRSRYSVATHQINRGQGDALRTGFAIALEQGSDIIITMDADGQHRPDQLSALIKPIAAGEADYVQGSRFLGEYDDAGGVRHFGIQIFTRLINLLSHAGISDCTNGYRAIRAEKLALMRLEEDRFSAPEIIMEAAAKGLRIVEIPVHIQARSHGESKKPNRLGYPLGFARTIVAVWLR